MNDEDQYIECKICGKKMSCMTTLHLDKYHNISYMTYVQRYPEAKVTAKSIPVTRGIKAKRGRPNSVFLKQRLEVLERRIPQVAHIYSLASSPEARATWWPELKELRHEAKQIEEELATPTTEKPKSKKKSKSKRRSRRQPAG